MRPDSLSPSVSIPWFGRNVPRLASLTRLGMLATMAALVFLTQGCVAALTAPLLKGSNPDKVSVASGQKEVKAELGKPIASQGTPDGGRVDTYDVRFERTGQQRDTVSLGSVDGKAVQGLFLYALSNIVTFGALDLAVSSFFVYYKLKTDPRGRVKIAFGPDDRVVWIGSPPPYGPLDAAVPLSIGAIREGCRSQADGEPSERRAGAGAEHLSPSGDNYVTCVGHRFAIWGLE